MGFIQTLRSFFKASTLRDHRAHGKEKLTPPPLLKKKTAIPQPKGKAKR